MAITRSASSQQRPRPQSVPVGDGGVLAAVDDDGVGVSRSIARALAHAQSETLVGVLSGLRKAGIGKVGMQIGVEKDVCGLHIAVNYPGLCHARRVQVAERLGRLLHHLVRETIRGN